MKIAFVGPLKYTNSLAVTNSCIHKYIYILYSGFFAKITEVCKHICMVYLPIHVLPKPPKCRWIHHKLSVWVFWSQNCFYLELYTLLHPHTVSPSFHRLLIGSKRNSYVAVVWSSSHHPQSKAKPWIKEKNLTQTFNVRRSYLHFLHYLPTFVGI